MSHMSAPLGAPLSGALSDLSMYEWPSERFTQFNRGPLPNPIVVTVVGSLD